METFPSEKGVGIHSTVTVINEIPVSFPYSVNPNLKYDLRNAKEVGRHRGNTRLQSSE